MNRRSSPWSPALVGAAYGAVVATIDAARLMVFPDWAVFTALAAAACGALGAVVVLAATARLHRLWRALILCALALPAAVDAGRHIAVSATGMRLVPPTIGWPLASAALTVLLAGTAFAAAAIHHRAPSRGPARVAVAIACAVAGIACAHRAFALHALHAPLSLVLLLVGLLAFVAARPFGDIPAFADKTWARRAIALAAIAALVGATLWPLSISSAFAAVESGVVSSWLAPLTRFTPLDDAARGVSPDLWIAAARRPHAVDPTALPRRPGKSVLLITFDATRADHVHFLGYRRRTTPFLDTLAARAVVFENAYSSSATSAFSLPSLFAGIHLEQGIRDKAHLPVFLPSYLKKHGYTSLALHTKTIFSVARTASAQVRATKLGFDRVYYGAKEATVDVPRFIAMVRRTAHRPLLAWIHLSDPHAPYDCHDAPFGTDDPACYDAEILHADAAAEKLVTALFPLLDDPIVIFTSDHGEAFGEHGKRWHSSDIYNEQVKVPLFILVPGLPPRRVATPVSNVQVAETIRNLVSPPRQPGPEDLRPLMVGARPEHAPPVPVGFRTKRGLIADGWKLMCAALPQGPCALYHLDRDPGETRNLAGIHPQRTLQLLRLLVAFEAYQQEQRRRRPPYRVALQNLLAAPDAPNRPSQPNH